MAEGLFDAGQNQDLTEKTSYDAAIYNLLYRSNLDFLNHTPREPVVFEPPSDDEFVVRSRGLMFELEGRQPLDFNPLSRPRWREDTDEHDDTQPRPPCPPGDIRDLQRHALNDAHNNFLKAGGEDVLRQLERAAQSSTIVFDPDSPASILRAAGGLLGPLVRSVSERLVNGSTANSCPVRPLPIRPLQMPATTSEALRRASGLPEGPIVPEVVKQVTGRALDGVIARKPQLAMAAAVVVTGSVVAQAAAISAKPTPADKPTAIIVPIESASKPSNTVTPASQQKIPEKTIALADRILKPSGTEITYIPSRPTHLSSIARDIGVDVDMLRTANPHLDPRGEIAAGSKVGGIVNATRLILDSPVTVGEAARSYGLTDDAIRSVNTLNEDGRVEGELVVPRKIVRLDDGVRPNISALVSSYGLTEAQARALSFTNNMAPAGYLVLPNNSKIAQEVDAIEELVITAQLPTDPPAQPLAEETTPTPEPIPPVEPAVSVEPPAAPPIEPAQTISPYGADVFASQRDNPDMGQRPNEKRISASNTCNITSLTMALQGLGLLNDVPAGAQPEQVVVLKYLSDLAKKGKDITDPFALQKLAEQFGAKGQVREVQNEFLFWVDLNNRLLSGQKAIMSISGHIVHVKEISLLGIVVDDPAGASVLLHKVNGRWVSDSNPNITNISGKEWYEFSALNSKTPATPNQPGQPGDNNIWPWSDVEDFQHFNWVLTLEGGAPPTISPPVQPESIAQPLAPSEPQTPATPEPVAQIEQPVAPEGQVDYAAVEAIIKNILPISAGIPPEYAALIKGSDYFTAIQLAAQIKNESNFDPNAQSGAGAIGLGQFTRGAWSEMGKRYPELTNPDAPRTDPNESIVRQRLYMDDMHELVLKKIAEGKISGDPMELTYAAYNAGMGNVEKYGGIPPFTETRNYITRIHNTTAEYMLKVAEENAIQS